MIVIPKKDQFTELFLFTLNPEKPTVPVQFIIKKDYSNLDTYSVTNLLRIAKLANVPKYDELTYSELLEGIKASITFE